MRYFVLMMLLSFGVMAQGTGFYDYADHSLISPAEGMWFDKDEPGRGVTLEIQDERILATYFGYKVDGSVQWWQGVGYRDANNQNKYTGNFDAGKDGQCVGCPYVAPVADPAQAIGEFSLVFANDNEAQFNWAGKPMTLVKYYYGYAKTIDRAKGLWTLRKLDNLSVSNARDFLLWDERTAGDDKRKVVTGIELRTFNIAAAVSVLVPGIDQEVVVFAYAQPVGDNRHSEAFVVKLGHVSGKSDIASPTATGYFSPLDSEMVDGNSPIEAVRVASLDQAQPYIDYNSQFLSEMKSLSKGDKSVSVDNKASEHINLKIVEAMTLLQEVIDDIYAEL